MPGLPYPAFRTVNAEPGGGEPSPYGERLPTEAFLLAHVYARRERLLASTG